MQCTFSRALSSALTVDVPAECVTVATSDMSVRLGGRRAGWVHVPYVELPSLLRRPQACHAVS